MVLPVQKLHPLCLHCYMVIEWLEFPATFPEKERGVSVRNRTVTSSLRQTQSDDAALNFRIIVLNFTTITLNTTIIVPGNIPSDRQFWSCVRSRVTWPVEMSASSVSDEKMSVPGTILSGQIGKQKCLKGGCYKTPNPRSYLNLVTTLVFSRVLQFHKVPW